MKRLKIQKLLAMAMCLLLCVIAAGASADAGWESPPVDVDMPEHVATENSETIPPAPDQDAADTGTETPGEEVRDQGEQTVEEDQAVEDVPKAVFHTVLFVGQGDAILETRQVEEGNRVDEPRNPAAPKGYAFAYWYDDAGIGQPFDFNLPIACDMKLRAKFIEIAVEQDGGDAADGEAGAVTGVDAEPLSGEGEPEFELSEEEQAMIILGPPRVEVEYAFEGDVLLEGALVTLTARVYNIPEDTALTFQWQNDATGRFEDVSGATEQTYTFYAGADNSGCRWRVRVEG